MKKHEHQFKVFVGMPTAWGKTAWIREDFTKGHTQDLPRKLACDTCGEQGYEIR